MDEPPTSFAAARWLRNPHMQTIWGKFAPRRERTPLHSIMLELPDGDALELVRLDAPSDRPRMLILHGLEGSERSHYVRGLFAQAHLRGWGADLLVFRSCSAELNRLPRSYHSGETTDLAFVVSHVLSEFPEASLGIAGYSLGGNVLLKWLGECGTTVPARVRAAAAVSVPYDLDASCEHLSKGLSRGYERFFVRQLIRKAERKRALHPGAFANVRVDRIRSLRDFDDAVTAPLHGFRDAADYYARSSSGQFLEAIRRPTLLLSAADDPFLPIEVLESVRARAARNEWLTIEFPAQGGHVGFIGGRWPWRPEYYAELRVAQFLAVHMGGPAGPVAGTSPVAYNLG